jgi:hypothetical protein
MRCEADAMDGGGAIAAEAPRPAELAAEAAARELHLRAEMSRQAAAAAVAREESRVEVAAVGCELTALSKRLDQAEVERINGESAAAAEAAAQRAAVERQVRAEGAAKLATLEARALEQAEELRYVREALSTSEARLSQERAAHARSTEHSARELAQTRDRLVERTEVLLRVGEGGEHAPGLAAAASEIAKILEEERAKEKCCVCLTAERRAVLLPCRHAVLCDACADHVKRSSGRCPLCRVGIESTLSVFK